MTPRGDDGTPVESSGPAEPDGIVPTDAHPAGRWDNPPLPADPWPQLDEGRPATRPVQLPAPMPDPDVRRPSQTRLPDFTFMGEDELLQWRRTQKPGAWWATLSYEVKGHRGEEPPGLITGGGVMALGIIGAVASLIACFAFVATSDPGGAVVAGIVLATFLALVVIGYRRFQRHDLGGRP